MDDATMNFFDTASRTLVVLAIAAVAAPAAAWTGPSTAPPGGNVAAPVNVSGTAQSKTGFLNINNGYGGASYPLSVGSAGSYAGVFNWPNTNGGYGILAGGAYSYFQNPSGYYAQLAYSSYGLYTNGNVYASDVYSSAAGMWMSQIAAGGATYSASQSGYAGAVYSGHLGTLSCASGYYMYAIYYDFGGAGWNDAFSASMTIYCRRI